MKLDFKILYFFVLFLVIFSCNQAVIIDKKTLKTELDSIYQEDQKYRGEIVLSIEKTGWFSPETKQFWALQNSIDSANLQRITEIIEEIGGYPGKSLVGDTASRTAFYVLQHAPDSIQEVYHELIMNAAKNDELDKSKAALYHDRYLMHKGEPQVYGTQLSTKFRRDSITGETIDITFLSPIADTTNIDSLRKSVGLGSLEEYLNSFGVSRWD